MFVESLRPQISLVFRSGSAPPSFLFPSMSPFLCQSTVQNLAHKSIRLSGPLCDGGRYQVKALDFTDPDSVHFGADEPLLNRFLFRPCLCYCLNNAYQTLFRECRPFHEFLTGLRAIGKMCRKTCEHDSLFSHAPRFPRNLMVM
jgi:hypothetical protein